MSISSHALYQAVQQDLTSYLGHTCPPDLFPGVTPQEAACIALSKSLLKKFIESSDAADAAAIDDFVKCNNSLENYPERYADRVSRLNTVQFIALCEAQARLHDCFSSFDTPHGEMSFADIYRGIDVGPGASIGATGGSFYHKLFCSQLTVASLDALKLFLAYAGMDPTFDSAIRNNIATFGPPRIVQGSKLSCVAKNALISRAICTEPSVNMLLQKGFGSVLECLLVREFGIDLSVQPSIQAHLAQMGSIDRVLCTQDLRSASNLIPLMLFHDDRWCPPFTRECIDTFRSPKCDIPGQGFVPLHMVSSMGNGFTFPLMTLLICTLIFGVYKARGIPFIKPRVVRRGSFDARIEHYGTFGVFGDDIVVHREAYDDLIVLLTTIGMSVNEGKSFKDEDFRESCGSDFIAGYEIRGVYCYSLSTQHDRMSLLNNLSIWSCNHSVPLLHTCLLLYRSVDKIHVPIWEGDTAGVKVPEIALPDCGTVGRGEFDSYQYKRWVPRVHHIPAELLDRHWPVAAKQRARAIDKAYRELLGRAPTRTEVKFASRLTRNPDGFILAASKGSLQGGVMALRTITTHYRKTDSITPCWDYVDLAAVKLTLTGWRNWVTGLAHSFLTAT